MEFESSLGKVRVKIKRTDESKVELFPEYEDCSRIARECHLPLRDVIRIIEVEARKNFGLNL